MSPSASVYGWDDQEPEAQIHGWMTLTKNLAPLCLCCLKYIKFGQLILRKIIMVALRNRADHYIFSLWFRSFFFILFFLANLSRHRLDVCHTSTRGVALMQIRMQF